MAVFSAKVDYTEGKEQQMHEKISALKVIYSFIVAKPTKLLALSKYFYLLHIDLR